MAISANKTTGLTDEDWADAEQRGLVNSTAVDFLSIDNNDDPNNIVDPHLYDYPRPVNLVNGYRVEGVVTWGYEGFTVDMERLTLEMIDGQQIPAFRPVGGVSQSENFRSNCHGYTIGGGRFWISDNAINDWFCNQQLYQEIDDPRDVLRGDIVLWRRGTGIVHSAVFDTSPYVTQMAGHHVFGDGRGINRSHLASAWYGASKYGDAFQYMGRIDPRRQLRSIIRPKILLSQIVSLRSVSPRVRQTVVTPHLLRQQRARLRPRLNIYEFERQMAAENLLLPARFSGGGVIGIANRF